MKQETTHNPKPRMAMLAVFAVLLLLPLLQELTGIFPERPLAGVENPPSEVELNAASWLDGTFQKDFETQYYQWMGLRSAMVRGSNQLDYSLFGLLYDRTLVGESGELFRRTSYEALTGRDYIGHEKVAYHANHLAYLQQYLFQRNIRLLPVITPTKLRCMPQEKVNYDLSPLDTTNYDAYLKAFSQYQLAYLDLTEVLSKAIKDDPHRVFPKTGSHWTDYGAALGFRFIVEQMEASTGLDYADFSIEGFETTSEMRGTDADAGDILNLIRDFDPAPIDYPELSFANQAPKVRPRVLVISDSFWWKIYDQQLHAKTFAPGAQYRYYNWEVFSENWEGARNIEEFDLAKTLESIDWIILATNEGNFRKFPFGFLDQVLASYGISSP